MKPIHKFNNGRGATLCNQCSVIITTGLTDDLYCKECKDHRKKLLIEIMKEDEDLGLYIEQMEKEESEKETLEEALERIRQESFTCCSLSKSINYVTVGEREKTAFYKGAKWSQEQDKKMYIALETAISLLKQTTEFEVLDSWKQKVKELEQLIK
jgi:hypothetical protein